MTHPELRELACLPGRRPAAFLAHAKRLSLSWDAEGVDLSPEAVAELDADHPIGGTPKVFTLATKRATPKPAPPPSRAPLPIPADFDPEHEKRRAAQGGCCGQPTE